MPVFGSVGGLRAIGYIGAQAPLGRPWGCPRATILVVDDESELREKLALGPATRRFLAETGLPAIEKPFVPAGVTRVLAGLLRT